MTADETRTVHRYAWTDDPRWLLYLQDDGGDENWHVFRVDLDDAAASAVDLHELDIATGELTLLVENPGSVVSWLYAGEGLSRRDGETGELHRVATFDGTDYVVNVHRCEVTPDGTEAWIGSSRGTDQTRLVRLDLATGEETEVDSHPSFDLDTRAQVFPTLPAPLIRHRRTGELIGARYLGERQVIHARDPYFAEVLENLESLSDGDLAAVSSDNDGQRWVVSFTHDRDSGVTWFYDHATGEGRLLFRPNPHLDPDTMAPMRPVTITARDGLALPSYLTLPVGIEPSRLPLMVHGGPWTRDSWGLDKSGPCRNTPSLVNNWYRYVGDPDDPAQEADMLARSPISRVDEIRTPLMVVQGANDVRVVQAESDNLIEALRARGVDVEYLVFPDEGHMFVNPENLIAMFRAAERFLARHLGGRTDHA